MSQLLTGQEQALFNKIKKLAFIEAEEPITLSSGKTSKFYFDLKRLTGDAEGINLAAKVLYEKIKKIGKMASVGGMEVGSIPLATTVSFLSFREDPDSSIQSFFIRKKAKEHGMKRRLEGVVKSPVIVLDDVITSGHSALEALDYLGELNNIEINCVITIIYRGTKEEAQNFKKKHGVELQYIFLEEDFTKN